MNICDGKAKAEDEDKDIAKLPIGSVFEFEGDIYMLCGWCQSRNPYAVCLSKNTLRLVPLGSYTKLLPNACIKLEG